MSGSSSQFYNSQERHQNQIILESSQATTYQPEIGYAEWIMRNPITFPGEPSICLHKLQYRNYFVNIRTGVNDTVTLTDSTGPTVYNLVVNEGSYSLFDLNDALVNAQQQEGLVVFTLTPDYATNSAKILYGNVSGYYITFGASSMYTLLGWNLNDNVPASLSNDPYDYFISTNNPTFDAITSVRVYSNLIDETIVDEGLYPIIFVSTPAVENGLLQIETPINLVKIPSQMLKSSISRIIIQLLDQNNNPLSLEDNFGVTLVVDY